MKRNNFSKPKDNFARNMTIVAVALIVIITAIVIFANKATEASKSDSSPKNTINDGFVINSDGSLQKSDGYKIADKPVPTDVKFDKDNINVTIYSDYDCPYCYKFEEAVGPTVDKLLKDGKIKTLTINPVSFQTAWSGSSQNLVACVANYQPELFQDANREVMLAHETKPDNKTLFAAINKSSGKKVNAEVQRCTVGGEFNQWVQSSTINSQDGVYPPASTVGGIKGTPSIFINGEEYGANPSPETFEAAIKHVSEGKSLLTDAPEADISVE